MASGTITPGTNDVSDYNSRLVTVAVTGGKYREMMRLGTYTLTIPYSCLSQTIQRIHRLGGKINHVTMPHLDSEVSKFESYQVLEVSAENHVLAAPNEVVDSAPNEVVDSAPNEVVDSAPNEVVDSAPNEVVDSAPNEVEPVSPSPQPSPPKNSSNKRPATKSTNGKQGQKSKRKPKN